MLFLSAISTATLASEAGSNRVSSAASVTFVYRASPQELDDAVTATASNLWRVEFVSGASEPLRQHWTHGTSDRISVREAFAELDCRRLKYFWMPPKVPPRKVSEGGRIVPVRSAIWLTIGSLRTNTNIAFITLTRDLEEKTTLHIPHTEIPFGRGMSSTLGVYETDLIWLRNLLGTNAPLHELVGSQCYDAEVMSILRTSAANVGAVREK